MIQSSVSNSINEILVSTFFLFYNEKRKKNQFLHRCLPLQSSEKYSLFSLTSIEPYPVLMDIKSLISLTDIQDKFNNSFLIILSSVCLRVHICNFIINTVIKLPKRSCTTRYNLILSRCRI